MSQQLIAHYLRPWDKRPRARDIVIETAPIRAGRLMKRLVVARIPRTDDVYADHALADVVLLAFELADCAQDLIRDGVVDSFGEFTYLAPPRARMDAIARMKAVLSKLPPPPPLTRCGICRVRT